MTYEQKEELEEKLDILSDKVEWSDPKYKFENMENKLHENEDIAAILFLYSKVKEEHRPQRWFLHGEHDTLYIGNSCDIFEEFTDEDVEKSYIMGIRTSSEGDGFEINVSM